MSDLRFFADTMHSLIAADRRADAAERRVAAVLQAAQTHRAKAQTCADEIIRSTHRPTVEWHRATAEVAAARVIERAASA